jgi:flagellar biosynthesis protein FlhG
MSSTAKSYQLIRGRLESDATIIAVGGGKGGIGKSFVTSGIAIFLSQLGHETILVDLDLGSANLHTALGEGLPAHGINEFLADPNMSLMDVATKTAFPNLKLISGCTEHLGVADINEFQRSRLLSSIFRLKAPFVVLDLSAGTHNSTLDFFLTATHKVVVFTPEPTSIENAYRFLKAAVYRKIRRFENQLHLTDVVEDLMARREQIGIRSPADLLKEVVRRDTQNGPHLLHLMSQLNLDIILNQTRTLKDVDLGPSLQGVCTKYFGLPFSYLGHLEYDNAVWQAQRKRRHLIVEYPHSRVYVQLMNIARRLATAHAKQAMVG